jgi:hypothetical protein
MTRSSMLLSREELVEQAYLFRIIRERLMDNIPAQDILASIDEELLSTTRLPMAVQFLSGELKHHGLLGPGMARLPHYFTRFQAFVIDQAEHATQKFTMLSALLVLEREAAYKAENPTFAGLLIYQFEAIARNRLGYTEGLIAVSEDPFYPPEWRDLIEMMRKQVGLVDFADLVYLRSFQYVADQQRTNPAYEPSLPPLFGEKEGKIAKASRGRDPLFLFSALQRQLNYPEVPRPRPRDESSTKLDQLQIKVRDLEARIRMLEAEAGGTFDPTQFGKPETLQDLPDLG